MFCHYISCIYSYRLWNILTVLLTVILSYNHISLMFCHFISCIYGYWLWNVLTVILSHIHTFAHVLSLHILYIQLHTVKCLACIINCNIALFSYFPHELIKAGGRTICLEIHKHITSIWKKEKLPEEWKELIIVPILKNGYKTECNNNRGISLLPTTYTVQLIPYSR